MGDLFNTSLEIASFSLKEIEVVSKEGGTYPKKYKTLVKKIPAMIQKNGLINTMAFLISKRKEKEPTIHEVVLRQMIAWSRRSCKTWFIKSMELHPDFEGDNVKGYMEYINAVFSLSSKEYRILSQEFISLFSWMKRFADGVIEGEEEA